MQSNKDGQRGIGMKDKIYQQLVYQSTKDDIICPHCGSDIVTVNTVLTIRKPKWFSRKGGRIDTQYYCQCPICYCRTKKYEFEYQAKKIWATRYNPTKINEFSNTIPFIIDAEWPTKASRHRLIKLTIKEGTYMLNLNQIREIVRCFDWASSRMYVDDSKAEFIKDDDSQSD